jgi:HSP20 family protein
MNDEKNTAVAPAKSEEKALTTATETNEKEEGLSPIFVEAEKMFERFAELTKETARKAYEFFQKRGGEFGRELDDWFKAESEILRPVPVEITETDGNINVSASVAGFKPEEIEVSVDGKTLILNGKTEKEEKKEDENTVYTEWRSNRFFRQLTLPCEVDGAKTEANLKDGVLRLTLPKLPAHEAAQIKVKAE